MQDAVHSYFNPRSPHGERLVIPPSIVLPPFHFNPRSPHGERPVLRVKLPPCDGISIHAPRTGSDGDSLPCSTHRSFISIHAPRTGSDTGKLELHFDKPISIHAPRTGSDGRAGRRTVQPGISIHAPRTGSDGQQADNRQGALHFNPRSPHGERRQAERRLFPAAHFNPRSPHGERLFARFLH